MEYKRSTLKHTSVRTAVQTYFSKPAFCYHAINITKFRNVDKVLQTHFSRHALAKQLNATSNCLL